MNKSHSTTDSGTASETTTQTSGLPAHEGLLQTRPQTRPSPSKLRLAVCVIVKNEGDGILEWGLYHHLIGFDALIIVDDQSTDHTQEEVDRLSKVTTVHRHKYRRWFGGRQVDAYQRICKKYRRRYDWIAFIDADEFIFSAKGSNIRDLLHTDTQVSAVVLPWLFFGSSGHVEKPNELVLKAYTHRGEFDNFPPNKHVKSIVRPNKVKRCQNPHAFEVEGLTVDANGVEVTWQKRKGLLTEYADYADWRINHYFTKSQQNWAERLKRGQLGARTQRTAKQFETYDKNTVSDPSAFELADKVRALMDRLGGPKKEMTDDG